MATRQTVAMYLNGQFISEVQMHIALSDIPDNNNWLGRSQWPDTMYVGSYNEFRIYDHALSAAEVAASLAAGTERSPATLISPAAGAQNVPQLAAFAWTQGILPDGTTGLMYQLYVSDNAAAVETRSPAAKIAEVAPTSYTIGAAQILATDTTYYWAVDESVVLPGMSEPNVIAGALQSFETVKTLPTLTVPVAAIGPEGGSAVIRVGIASQSPVSDVAWYKYVDGINDLAVTDGAKYAIAYTNAQTTLTVNNHSAADVGAYYCAVENSAGVKMSANVPLALGHGLVHRYTFDRTGQADEDPNVVDVVGDANGMLFNRTGSARFENGQLLLGNTGQTSNSGTGNYVNLPNGIISALDNFATFEMWITWDGPRGSFWQRVFDFGTSNGGEDLSPAADDTYYVMLTPLGGPSTLRTGYKKGTGQAPNGGSQPNGEERVLDDSKGPLLVTGEQTHLVVVWDGTSNTVRMYRNGVRAAQGNIHFALRDIPDNNNWLGAHSGMIQCSVEVIMNSASTTFLFRTTLSWHTPRRVRTHWMRFWCVTPTRPVTLTATARSIWRIWQSWPIRG